VPHPIFDSLSYPWARLEADALHQSLVAVIDGKNEILALFVKAGGLAGAVNRDQSPSDLWHDVLDRVTKAGHLQLMLEKLREVSADNAAFQTAVQAVFDAAPVAEAQVYGSGPVVLDRDPLRTKLSSLEADTLPLNVLVVRGETKTGKSYGRHLFERVARSRGAKVAYLWSGNAPSLDAALEELFLALGVDEVPEPGDTTDTAWYQEILRDLRRAAGKAGSSLWVTVDDLGNGPDGVPLIDSAVRAFCDQFALNLLNPVFAERFRLMLIHYPNGPVPTRWPSELWVEDVARAEAIEESHVQAYLAAWAAARGRVLHDSELTALAAEIIATGEAEPGPNGPCRLERLLAAMTDALQGLERLR